MVMINGFFDLMDVNKINISTQAEYLVNFCKIWSHKCSCGLCILSYGFAPEMR